LAPAEAPRAPSPPLIAPTGSPGVNAVIDAVNATAAPFTSAPPPHEGTAAKVARIVGGVAGLVGAPAKIIDTAFAALTAPIAAMVPSMPAITLLGMHVGTPHAHTHPPSLIPPAPPVPLPSIGMLVGAGAVTVLIGGVPAARAGDIGMSVTCGSLAPPFEVYTGSSNVFIGGARAARMADITKHCNPTAVGAFDIVMGAAGAVAGAAGAIASSNPWAAVQAAADAAVLALKMLVGKDPGIPPGMGMLVGPPVPNVLIGGFPCPPVGAMAVGGLLKALQKAVRALKGGSPESNGCKGNSGHPIYVVTGENFDKYVDFVSGGLFEWRRHYSSARAREDGPLGRGWRHFYQRSLSVRLDRATFVDWSGLRVEFPRFPFGSDTVRAGGRVLKRVARGQYRLSYLSQPELEFAGGPFDRDLRLVRVTSAERELSFEYDPQGRPVVAVERERRTGDLSRFELRYDAGGHLTHVLQIPWSTSEQRPDGAPKARATYEYGAGTVLTQASDAKGGLWSYEYDGFHRMAKQSDPRSYSYTYRYDALGRCVETSGQDGLWKSKIEYFPEKKFSRYTEGEATWEVHYDDDGVITKVVDPYGGETIRERDSDGKLVREVDSGGRELRWLYDADGAHHARVDRFGNAFPPEVEMPKRPNPFAPKIPDTARGRLLEGGSKPPSSATFGADESLLYALASELDPHVLRVFRVRPRAVEGPSPAPQPQVERDALGRKTREVDVLGRERRWTYDETGNLVAMRDRDGRVTSWATTSWNLVGERRDPLGHAIQYQHSSIEKIVGVTDPLGNVTRYEHDLKGRLVRVKRSGRVRDEYVYDEGDHFVEKRDGDGAVLFTNQPHANHFVKERRLASGGVHKFDYDPRGRVTKASTEAHEVDLAWDPWGRRVCDVRDGVGVEHDHGANGSVRTRALRLFVSNARRGDAATRLVNPAGKETSLSYRDDGVVVRRCSNGKTEVLQYDADGRLLGHVVYGLDGRRAPTRWSAAYTYTAEGDLVQRDDSVRGTSRYEVDSAHRLIGEVTPWGERKVYTQDAANNVRLCRLEIGADNRPFRSADEVFEHDGRDRLAERRHQDGTVVHYAYDSVDMLLRVERSTSDGAPPLVWEAAYDALGRRTETRWAGKRRQFYYDGDRLAAEVLPDGRARIYEYATNDALVPLGFVEYDSLEAAPASGRTFQVFSDPSGMPLHVEDERGDVVWQAEWIHPFGAVRVSEGARIEYNLRWPGHYYDPEIRLHYNRYRYYDPQLGRYLQSDPTGYKGSPVNLYAYCANPLVRVDVFGLHDDRAEPGEEEGQPNNSNKEEEPSLPEPGGDPNAPKRNGDPLNSNDRTADQENYFREQIEKAPNDQKAQQARYNRNCTTRDNRGQEHLTPEEWSAQNDTLRANQSRGADAEDAAFSSLGIKNNNLTNDPVEYPMNPDNPDGPQTRPDAVTDKSAVDVKSVPDKPGPDGDPHTVYNTDQLGAQQNGADENGLNHTTVISNSNPEAARPSGPLAENSQVLHHNPSTDQWSQWDPESNGGDGGWKPITNNEARNLVGTN
jgi:RHS repeat-associated protein